jgi:hypothetical protein
MLQLESETLQFLYTADISVDKITPQFGYTSGEFPIFVFGSNFLNTSSLGWRIRNGLTATNASASPSQWTITTSAKASVSLLMSCSATEGKPR